MKGFIRRFLDIYKVYKSDGIFITLSVVPLGPSFLNGYTSKLAKKTIYDIDDMIFHLRTAPANKITKFLKSKKRFYFLLEKANHCITCTPELDKIAQKYNKNTTDISSTINTKTYIPVNKYENKQDLIIGWTGSHSTVPYLHLLDGVLQQLSQKYKFKLLVMGTNNFKISGVDIECLKWNSNIEISTLQKLYWTLSPS